MRVISIPSKNINNIFFEDFYAPIIIDVLLLLFSFFHSDRFHQIIRNLVCHFDHVNKVIIFDGRASKQRFNCWRRAFWTINTCDT
jgi:hypothetical protein